jgi:hypothetical protein
VFSTKASPLVFVMQPLWGFYKENSGKNPSARELDCMVKYTSPLCFFLFLLIFPLCQLKAHHPRAN